MSKEKEGKGKSDKTAPAKTLKEKRAAKTAKRNEKRSEDWYLNPGKVENAEQEKGKTFIIVEIIEYIPNAVVIKMIIKKTTGNMTVSSFDSGQALAEKTTPFDTFIQVIDGKAEIVIEDRPHHLDTGDAIVIPAHSRNSIKANVRFKMISTVIKSGYEDLAI